MSKVHTTRRIDLTALSFPASQRWDGSDAVIEADVPESDLQTAVDGAPGHVDVDPDAELDGALAAIDTSTVSDAATRDALDATIAALRGNAGRAGAAAGRRPTT